MSDTAGGVARCLCYTTDINYALPTLLSAVQARANLSPRTDVVVILIGASASDAEDFREACRTEDIVPVDVPRSAIGDLTIDYARYCLDDLIDARYRCVTHIDGDTHILGTLDPLLDFDTAPGRVLAVIDPMALVAGTAGGAWRHHRKRFAAIGIAPEFADRYVNTGLFQARREDLADMGEACRTLALKEGPRMFFGQQDAFNVVLRPMIDRASLRWNYPAFFSNFGFGSLVEPRVRHFMSDPRPWQGRFPPWGSAGHAPYVDLVRRHPALARLLSPLRGHRRVRYEVQQRWKRAVEPVFWDTKHIHQRIADHEAASLV